MRFDAGTRTRLLVKMETDFDPTGSTVEVKVGPTWFPATWQGSPVQAAGKWTQTARTTAYFAGPDADQSGAVLLEGPAIPGPGAFKRHFTQTRVTSGTDIIADDSDPIDVS